MNNYSFVMIQYFFYFVNSFIKYFVKQSFFLIWKKLWYNFSKKFWLKGVKEKKDGNKLFRTGSEFEAKFIL